MNSKFTTSNQSTKLTKSTTSLRALTLSAAAFICTLAGQPLAAATADTLRNCPPPIPTDAPNTPTLLVCGTPPFPYADNQRPIIQIALCLDTSGSMEGLLNQARTRLWDLVNFLSTAKVNGQTPRLEVALYQYGSTQAPARAGYLRCLQPFTSDLDLVSERLFGLAIGGSSEQCGRVLSAALSDLKWREPTARFNEAPAYRTLVIAGNEEFTQGPIEYPAVAESAKGGSIFLNTIYCGPYADGERTGWLNAAYLNGGAYNHIDQSKRQEYTPCPQDDQIMVLNNRLNDTYISYTPAGSAAAARQIAQDSANLAASREAAVQRAASKASELYTNSSWDIVDAVKDGTVKVEDLATENLPAGMRPMHLKEREAHIERLRVEREHLRAEILRLTAERTAELRKREAERNAPATLDVALISSIRQQAERLGFAFTPD